jgi:hypothetical protein
MKPEETGKTIKGDLWKSILASVRDWETGEVFYSRCIPRASMKNKTNHSNTGLSP